MVRSSILLYGVITLCGLLSMPFSKAEVFGFSRITMTPTSCQGEEDGQLNIVVTGTQPGDTIRYQVAKSNPTVVRAQVNNGLFIDLPTGIYSITVLNQRTGQQITGLLPVVDPLPLMINSTNIKPVTNRGGADGQIMVAASGVGAPFRFFLNPGGVENSTGIFSNLRAGTYTVTVRSNQPCDAADVTVEVKEPLPS